MKYNMEKICSYGWHYMGEVDWGIGQRCNNIASYERLLI